MNTSRSYSMGVRAERAAATRGRIALAAKDLFLQQPYEAVTLAEIARASGVSHQTVLNHFESKEGVVLAAAELMAAETSGPRYAAEPGDVAASVRALVGEYERMGDANFRWAARAETLGEVAGLLDDARAGHQQWLADMFGARLPTAAAPRRRAVNALHAATDVYVWKLLRRDLGMTRAETEKTMALLVEGVLEGEHR